MQLTMLFACCAAPAAAQQVRPWTPPFTMEVVDLPVAANGVGYRLFIRKPISEPREGERPVAVYLLDALWDTPAVVAAQSNAEFLGHLPPIYYVGIGYQNENDGVRNEANRTRDYTPTAWAPKDPAQHFLTPVDYEHSGGAPAFLKVVEREIIPFVERRYPVDSSTRMLVGKSMGGLLATTALLTRPALFSHYLIISPALWWDDYFLDFRDRAVMRLEREGHATKLSRATRVWVGMGDGEERLGMLADVYVLGRALRLRQDSQLHLEIAVIAGEEHSSIYLPAFARGIRHLLWR
jgi:predicted alpha/beta superfamily hydrolase